MHLSRIKKTENKLLTYPSSRLGSGIFISHRCLLCSLFFGGVHCMACGILVPQPGIEPVPPAVEAQSLKHWTTREVPRVSLLNCISYLPYKVWYLSAPRSSNFVSYVHVYEQYIAWFHCHPHFIFVDSCINSSEIS